MACGDVANAAVHRRRFCEHSGRRNATANMAGAVVTNAAATSGAVANAAAAAGPLRTWPVVLLRTQLPPPVLVPTQLPLQRHREQGRRRCYEKGLDDIRSCR